MPEMKYYLAGKMTGLEEYGYQMFERAATELRSRGLEIVSPHELHPHETRATRSMGPYKLYAIAGITALLKCDAIILMEGWSTSKGARKELDFAINLGQKIFYWIDNKLIEIA